jgi:DHA1 family multidrug resistance protein-like MFS transporter
VALNRELLSLFVATAAINLAANIIGPFFPLYFQSLRAPVVVVGFLMSMINLVQAVLRIPGGLIADRFNGKWVIVASLAASMVPPVAFLFVTQWQQSIPWVLVSGIPFSLFLPVWNVTIANYSDPHNRARVFGLMNMAWPIGVIVGPVIGGLVAESLGWHAVMYSLIITYAAGLIPVLLISPRERHRERMPLRIDRSVIKSLAFFSLFQCLVSIGFAVTNTILSIYISSVLGATKDTVGMFWALCFGVTFLLTQIPGGRLAERLPPRRVLVLGVVAAPFLSVAMPLTRDLIIFLVLTAALNTLWNLSIPAGNVLFLDILPKNGKGFYTGLMQAIVMMAWTIGPFIGTLLYDLYGPASPFYTTAIFFALATLSIRVIRTRS